MAKSFWMSDQKGNFSNGGKDTFDETKDYIGIRLQQGVPLLDRDWNELEDIRRYQDWVLKDKYLGDGTPDNGFAISLISGKVDDFNISKGRCLVDGFEAVNRTNTSYSKQTDVAPLTIPTGKRTDLVYIDLWISEIHGTDDLKNDQDVKIETCARHKVEWRVRVSEDDNKPVPGPFHHVYIIASIERDGGTITAIKDQRTALKINPLFKVLSVGSSGNIGIGNNNPMRKLDVEGQIFIRGKGAGLSFANRDSPNEGEFIEDAADGQRWMWYASHQSARLWSAGDKLIVDKEGNLTVAGGITFSGNPSRRIYGDIRAGVQAVVLKGNWDELEVKGRVIDWTGSNFHIGYQNDHSNDFVYIGFGNARVKGVEINHGPQTGAKSGDNVGFKLLSKDNGGLIYGYDVNHSILFRVGQDGMAGVTDFHGSLGLRFYTGGNLESQKERMRINSNGAVGIGTSDPQRMLHVEGSEIHSGGSPTAGFSFANRDAPNKGAYVESGAEGQRWVWHATGQAAHLWAAGNKLDVDKDGNLNVAGGLTFSGNASRRIYGDLRAGVQAVVLKGHWDELEVKGRAIDWTGSNFYLGYQNDHSNDFIYIGSGKGRVKGVEINHGPQQNTKAGDNVGLRLQSADSGGLIYGNDINHSIFFRVGRDGATDVTDYREFGAHRFFTGGHLENQKERMRITASGSVGIGTTNPEAMLSVNGDIKFSGKLDVGAGYTLHGWYDASVKTNKFQVSYLGNPAAWLHGNSGEWTRQSSRLLKTNITPITNVLQKLDQIRGVYFHWKDTPMSVSDGALKERQIGIIAEEVEAVFPELVSRGTFENKEILGLAYSSFAAVLVQAVKELKAINESLSNRIKALEASTAH